MNNSIEINGEKYCTEDLLLLTGEEEIKEPEKVKSYILLVARALGLNRPGTRLSSARA